MNYLFLSRALFPIHSSLIPESGCKNKTIFYNHQIKSYKYFIAIISVRFTLELGFQNNSITVFKRLQKYNQ